MNEILMKLAKIYEEAEVVLKSLKLKENVLNDSHALLNKGHDDLKTRIIEIAQREEVLVSGENPFKKEADDLLAKTQEEAAKLETAKKDFESYKQTETDKLNNLRLSVQKESDNLVEQKKNNKQAIEDGIREFTDKHIKKG